MTDINKTPLKSEKEHAVNAPHGIGNAIKKWVSKISYGGHAKSLALGVLTGVAALAVAGGAVIAGVTVLTTFGILAGTPSMGALLAGTGLYMVGGGIHLATAKLARSGPFKASSFAAAAVLTAAAGFYGYTAADPHPSEVSLTPQFSSVATNLVAPVATTTFTEKSVIKLTSHVV